MGIGDINEPVYAAGRRKSVQQMAIIPTIQPPPLESSNDSIDPEEDEKEEEKKAEFLSSLQDAQIASLHAQEQSKTLSKLQQEIDAADKATKKSNGPIKHRPALVDNDRDLVFLEKVLINLHSTFYEKMDQNLVQQADVRVILPSIKNKILRGVKILFSGVIPLGMDPKAHDMWRHATLFGATCETELNDQVTHVIASKTGTAKVNNARKLPHVWIVKPEW